MLAKLATNLTILIVPIQPHIANMIALLALGFLLLHRLLLYAPMPLIPRDWCHAANIKTTPPLLGTNALLALYAPLSLWDN